jgi:NAD(P)-dependent dehydrogenase (short-subunit alcohol dehydrogenase family)
MIKKKNCLIIGASSNYGFKLCQLMSKKYNLYGTYNKNKITYLKNIYKLDLGSLKSINYFSNKLLNEGLRFDTILFLSAIQPSANKLKYNNRFYKEPIFDHFSQILNVNTFSQVILFEKIYKYSLIKKNATIIFFSSLAGSISMRGLMKHNKVGGDIIYRISKASLNCYIKNISFDLKNKFNILAVHPGWVSFNNKIKKQIDINKNIKNIFNIIESISKKDNGLFLDPNRKVIKW